MVSGAGRATDFFIASLEHAGFYVVRLLRGPLGLAVLIVACAPVYNIVADGRGNALVGASAVALLAMTAWAFVRGVTRRDPSMHWDNESLPDRIRNLVTLLHLARRSIIIHTGCGHHGLFDKDEVLRAMQALPRHIKITVVCERDQDEHSCWFWQELERRRARIVVLPPDLPENQRMSHGMSVDDLHCKVEKFGEPDDAETKHVDYFAFDRPRARAYRLDVERLIDSATMPQQRAV